jgi:hypothetical protein
MKPSLKLVSPQHLIEILKISVATGLLFLLIDLFFGAWVMSLIRPAERFRIQHPIYHHTLKPDYDGVGHWGTWSYRMCTNTEGFKDQCGASRTTRKDFDIAFIGDSFTEGIGLPYEQTFVGMVAAQRPDLTIANLGVVSYSPAIYLAKLKELFSKGYRFKHIIVFIDIGDAYDEANSYDLHNDAVVVDKGEPYPLSPFRKLRRMASQRLPLTAEAWVQLQKLNALQFSQGVQTVSKDSTARAVDNSDSAAQLAVAQPSVVPTENNIPAKQTPSPLVGDLPSLEQPFLNNIYEGVYLRNYPKSEWTYNIHSTHYGRLGVTGTIAKMRSEMQTLHALVQTYGAKLSVGVYPWPGQLKYDVVDSLQVKIWREFCQTNCAYFYDTFPAFFDLVKARGDDSVIHNYFFAGDVHFNERGNRVIADTILNVGIK